MSFFKRLLDRVAIVTGSSRGIGKAIALALAREEAHVVVNYSTNVQAAEKVAEEIRALGREALVIRADVSKRADVDQMVERVVDKFGRIDVLVNNAGVCTVRPAEVMSEEDWDRDIDIDLKGVFLCSQAVGRVMMKQNGGNIINIASMVAEIALPGHAAYCAAKAGVISLTKVLAIEWAKHNIRVNAIAPGFIETEMVSEMVAKGLRSKEELESIKKRAPMRRLGRPEEIARLALFLASEESEFMTGETIFMDGGYSIYGYV